MSKDKHPSIFSRRMDATGFFILQIFVATYAVSKIGEYLTIIHRSAGVVDISTTFTDTAVNNCFSIYYTR